MNWIDNEILFLKNNYPKYGIKFCSNKLNRTEDSIMNKARKLKLKHLKIHQQKINVFLYVKNIRIIVNFIKMNFIYII